SEQRPADPRRHVAVGRRLRLHAVAASGFVRFHTQRLTTARSVLILKHVPLFNLFRGRASTCVSASEQRAAPREPRRPVMPARRRRCPTSDNRLARRFTFLKQAPSAVIPFPRFSPAGSPTHRGLASLVRVRVLAPVRPASAREGCFVSFASLA